MAADLVSLTAGGERLRRTIAKLGWMDLSVIYGGTALVALATSALSFIGVGPSAKGNPLTVTKENIL